MSDPGYTWDTEDVFQNSNLTSSQADFSAPNDPSTDLAPNDPTSFLGFQFETGPGHFNQNYPCFLNQWHTAPKQPMSPTPPLENHNYAYERFMSSPDAWNPLRITGAPSEVTFSTRSVGSAGRFQRAIGYDARFSDPSETASQYTGLHSSDSGYESRSCTTRSIAASYTMDPASSPHLAPQNREHEQVEKMAPLDIEPAQHGEPDLMDIEERPESPLPASSFIGHDSVRCDHPGCPWTGRCPSDKRKHEARHRKQFKCDVPNCTRKEGFGTINDLARHKKCVHKKEPERGPKVLYMCFGKDCPRSSKKWPRLDNFRQHLARMHSDEDADDLLRRAREWYEHIKSLDLTPVFADVSEETTPTQIQAQSGPLAQEADDDEPRDNLAPTFNTFQLGPPQKIDVSYEHEQDMQEAPRQIGELSPLDELELEPAPRQETGHSSHAPNQAHDKMDDVISEAAVSVIHAMTKMINNRQRRSGCTAEDEQAGHGQEEALSGRNREILQRILSVASELLSESPETLDRMSYDKISAGLRMAVMDGMDEDEFMRGQSDGESTLNKPPRDRSAR